MSDTKCFACGALVPDIVGPTHAYMLAAPGCWSLYTSLTDWNIALPQARRAALADCYAVQHATNPERRNRQSVAFHLMSLCSSIEQREPALARPDWTHRDYPELLPRPAEYPVTVRHLADADDESRIESLDEMARTTWEAWSLHHGQIREWVGGALPQQFASQTPPGRRADR